MFRFVGRYVEVCHASLEELMIRHPLGVDFPGIFRVITLTGDED
jgi:hypothetical protein